MIDTIGLDQHFSVTKSEIICNHNNSRFIFKGLYRNISSIKSLEGADVAWVEEAQTVSQESLDYLIPTIRKPGSEIWFTFNPDTLEDPVYKNFVLTKRDDTIAKKINFQDNPNFPDVLRKEMEYLHRVDYERYLHIWEGEPRTNTDAQIFKGKYSVEDFDTPGNVNFYYGADFGFSADPSTLIRCFVADNRLYIDHEAWGLHIELDDLPRFYSSVPESEKWDIDADSSRPDTISYVRRKGYKIRGVVKTKVEDGIEFLRSFEKIIIHPRCKHTAEEFKHYSYVVDKLSGNITPKIEDKHNHCIDALRYSLIPIMRNRGQQSYSLR